MPRRSSPKKSPQVKYPGHLARTVGLQTVMYSRNYVSPVMHSHHKHEMEDFHVLFYQPRTISFLLVVVLALNVFSYNVVPLEEVGQSYENPREGFKSTSRM